MEKALRIFLQLPILTIYAKKKIAYNLPSVVIDDKSIQVIVTLKNTDKFSKYKEGTFFFNPIEENVGNYTVILKIVDIKTKKES